MEMDMDMGMHMNFYVGGLHNFLFEDWNATAAGAIVGFCIAVAAVMIALELVKLLRVYLAKVSRQNPLTPTADDVSQRTPLLRPLLIPTSVKAIRRKKILLHVAQSGLHIVQVVLAYLLMLAVMSYNVYIFISVIIASGLTYFATGIIRDQMIPRESVGLGLGVGGSERQPVPEDGSPTTCSQEIVADVHQSVMDRQPISC